ncbi:tannase and feruloyl esterase [Mycena epipterygia]|nr:tannase and feruloyl esterase [Mycena epipterygia]
MDLLGLNFKFFRLLKLLASGFPLLTSYYREPHAKCLALKSSLHLENTTILDVSYLTAGSKVKLHECVNWGEPEAYINTPLCRVRFLTNTTETSAIRTEAWLPDDWYGRFLGVGNGGLGGCIAYRELEYGSALHFATVGSNNGHDGKSGLPFFGNPEVLNDFSFRSIHVEAVLGKEIVEAYYGRPHDKSYYVGCSADGRQGTQTALRYPGDFDGIIAGAPATDWNHWLHWMGMLARYIGAPTLSTSPAFILPELWKIVAAEILKQCDGIDGVVDGIITEPDACDFQPEALVCQDENNSKCLIPPQIEALRKIYSPLYGDREDLIYPRYDPGSEGTYIFNGQFPQLPKVLRDIVPLFLDWLKYTILNTTEFNFSEYGPTHGRLMDAINPGGIATFDGDLSAFRDRGGKFLTKRVYDLVSRTLDMPSLDAFYRLFLVPGMGHCFGGPGAANFGQLGGTNAVNASSNNILLALVDWVERGVAPDTITGSTEDGATRVHCRYPRRSIWNGHAFACED